MQGESKFNYNDGPMPNTTTFCSPIKNLPDNRTEAYSGYMNTGNDTVARNSMLYFQFYPAINTLNFTNYTHAPVVLWLQGGN